MPQKAWSSKRERQYEHIKEGAKKKGRSTKTAKRIAAATVNKERARNRGGLHSGTSRPKGRTKEQLYNEAKRRGIEGRSSMTKAQLQRALAGKSK